MADPTWATELRNAVFAAGDRLSIDTRRGAHVVDVLSTIVERAAIFQAMAERCAACGKLHAADTLEWAQKPHSRHQCVDDVFGKGCGAIWVDRNARHAMAKIAEALGVELGELTPDELAEKVRARTAPLGQVETLRPEVLAFAHIMEQKLRENDHKSHWSDCAPSWLLGRLREETTELAGAIGSGYKSPEHIGREAADVANFAMMIADVAGALKAERAAPAADAPAAPEPCCETTERMNVCARPLGHSGECAETPEPAPEVAELLKLADSMGDGHGPLNVTIRRLAAALRSSEDRCDKLRAQRGRGVEVERQLKEARAALEAAEGERDVYARRVQELISQPPLEAAKKRIASLESDKATHLIWLNDRDRKIESLGAALEAAEARASRAETSILRVCQAIGCVYQAEGHNDAPADEATILDHIEQLSADAGQQRERATTAEKERDAALKSATEWEERAREAEAAAAKLEGPTNGVERGEDPTGFEDDTPNLLRDAESAAKSCEAGGYLRSAGVIRKLAAALQVRARSPQEPVFLPKCPHPEVLGATREHGGGELGPGVTARMMLWLADCVVVLDGRIDPLEKARGGR